jgi:hypothetical protein
MSAHLPNWLYASREIGGPCPGRIRRLGSRQLGVVFTYVDGGAYTSPGILGTVWRFHFGFGPAGGIDAGFTDAGIRGRLWNMRRGRALGLGWKPR